MASATPDKQPQKYFDDQFDDEEVLFVFRKHPVVMRKGLIFGLAAWLIGPVYTLILTVIYKNNPEKFPSPAFFFISLIFSVIIGTLLFIPSWVNWYYSVFIITDQRLIQITQKGLFNRSVVDMSLRQIQMVNYQVSGFQETLLGFGTIMMQTYVGDLVIHDVHHPGRIQKKILQILRGQGVNASGSSAGPAGALESEDEEETA